MPKYFHSQEEKEAQIAHWQNDMYYQKIVNTINASGNANISKAMVWYQVNKKWTTPRS